jgi:hypothetical protein
VGVIGKIFSIINKTKTEKSRIAIVPKIELVKTAPSSLGSYLKSSGQRMV